MAVAVARWIEHSKTAPGRLPPGNLRSGLQWPCFLPGMPHTAQPPSLSTLVRLPSLPIMFTVRFPHVS